MNPLVKQVLREHAGITPVRKSAPVLLALTATEKKEIRRKVHQRWEHEKAEGRYPSGLKPGEGAKNPYPA